MDALEEGSKQNHQFDLYSSISEKYASELIYEGRVAVIATNIEEQHRSDAEKSLLNKIQKGKMTDKNFYANMNNYLDFKTSVKYSKIIEAKLKDTNLNDKQKEYLNNELKRALAKIEIVAKKFYFHTSKPEETLYFSNSKEFIDFIDSQEGTAHSKSYRFDIYDSEELKDIYNTKPSKLFELAANTRDKIDSVSLNNLDKKISSILR